jgi:hypothetical protein
MDSLPKILTGSMFGAGEIGNILEEQKRLSYQNFILDLVKHPEKLAAMAAKLQKPLDNALVQGVTNTVQGDLAQRGLSQAPGIFAATESQALAPYQQQNANTALQAVMASLGLPAGTFGAPANTSGALQSFLKTLSPGSGGGGGTIADTGLTPPIDFGSLGVNA